MAAKSNNIIEIKDIQRFLQIIIGNWHVILLCTFFSAGIAYLYSYRLPAIYAAKTQILLRSEETSAIQLAGYYDYEKYANENTVIKSTNLIDAVISKLKLDISYYIVGRIQTKEVYFGTPFYVEAQIYSSSFYDFPFTLKIIDKDFYEISYSYNDQSFSERHRFGEPVIKQDYYLLVHNNSNAINASTVSSLKEITYQFIVHNRQNLVYSYKSSLEAQSLEYTAILEVTLEDEVPERAVMFLDTLAKVYLFNSLKTKIKINENTINYIDRQLKEVTTILDSIENILDNFKEQKEILNLTREEETYFGFLSSFESKKRTLELDLKSLEYLKNYIISNMNKELLPPSLYMDEKDGYLTKAISELYNLQVSINSALFSSTEKSTSIKEVEYRIELLRNDILKYIVNTTKAINEKIQSIEGEISYYTNLLKGVPQNQRAILNITRKLQVNEKMYLYLLEKRAETVIGRAGIVPEGSVIESAHSIGIVKPDKNKIYYSFISAGLLFAIVIGFMRFLFFAKIESIDELRESTQMSVLGEIYHSKEARDSYLIVDTQPRSFVTESFRAIRTNLEYLAPGSGTNCKVVLVTSNRPSAGKTFCSINLSTILAKGGKKVLLMELDLHKPKIHKAFSLTSEIGMSTFLVGKHSPAEVIVKNVIENLDVILSGPSPPNASELILSHNLIKLFEYARKQYDYVIIDTPPMGIISDALLIMKNSDINIFVLNTRQNPKEGINFAQNVSENNKIGSFALVLNNVKQKYSRYYYKKYKYDYGQGYLQES